MKNQIVAGRPVSFKRRRYGRTFFTWAYVEVGGQSVSLGDPWPCLNPKLSELEKAVQQVLDK